MKTEKISVNRLEQILTPYNSEIHNIPIIASFLHFADKENIHLLNDGHYNYVITDINTETKPAMSIILIISKNNDIIRLVIRYHETIVILNNIEENGKSELEDRSMELINIDTIPRDVGPWTHTGGQRKRRGINYDIKKNNLPSEELFWLFAVFMPFLVERANELSPKFVGN